MKNILLFLIIPLLFSCNPIDVKVPNQTLIVSSNGKLLNFNLDTQIISWEYISKQDSTGNRNCFVYDKNSIYLPFESGKFISTDIITGKINWTDHVSNSNGITNISATVDADGEIHFETENAVYAMTTPLVLEDKVYITTSHQPKFKVFNKQDGAFLSSDNIPTRFNLYKPTLCRNHIFVTSAVYLNMYTKSGIWTDYGIHDEAKFETPLYAQIQSDGKTLYLGEEAGKFYALPFNANANLYGENDITDPDNTFTKRSGLFKWIYQSSKYPKLATNFNSNTGLINRSFIVWVRNDDNLHALIGINTKNGTEKWIFEANEEILNWGISRDEIIGYTNNYIFILNHKGNIEEQYPIDPDLFPLSNIVSSETSDLIFSTTKGIAVLNRSDKKLILKIPYNFTQNEHNNDYIQYFGK